VSVVVMSAPGGMMVGSWFPSTRAALRLLEKEEREGTAHADAPPAKDRR
jgi:hypothetical protein